MLTLAADAIFSKAKSNTGATKVSKASLPTDNLVTLLAVGAPILLISFALLFSPNLATEDGLRCAPTSPMQNRFYMYNYCWENFVHYELNYTGRKLMKILIFFHLEQIVTIRMWLYHYVELGSYSMIHHKAFPYAFFCMAFVLAIPTIWWTLAESDVVKRQATYIMSGVEEGLTMTISVMSDMVEDKTERNKTDDNVGRRMQSMLTEKYDDEIKLKFEAFEAFLSKKAKSNKMAKGFIYRRLFTSILLVCVAVFMYQVYYLDDQDYFNCKLNWKAKNSEGTYGPLTGPASGTDYVRCSIGDVSTRRLLIVIYMMVVVLCFLGILLLTIKDSIAAHRAFNLLKMIPMIDETKVMSQSENSSMIMSWFGLKDIHILLFLAKENFSDHKLFETCNQARCMAKTTGVEYEAVLESLVSWGLEDDSDETTRNVLDNVTHGAN